MSQSEGLQVWRSSDDPTWNAELARLGGGSPIGRGSELAMENAESLAEEDVRENGCVDPICQEQTEQNEQTEQREQIEHHEQIEDYVPVDYVPGAVQKCSLTFPLTDAVCRELIEEEAGNEQLTKNWEGFLHSTAFSAPFVLNVAKSEELTKLVHAGIPHSLRPTVRCFSDLPLDLAATLACAHRCG